MKELVVAVTAAVLTSAACSLFEAMLYSAPVSDVETLSQKGRFAGLVGSERR